MVNIDVPAGGGALPLNTQIPMAHKWYTHTHVLLSQG